MKKNKQLMRFENKKEDSKVEFETEVEDATKYGEFVCSYFAWISLPEQKNKAEELQNITKRRK